VKRQPAITYTLLDEMTASPTEPMPAVKRTHQLNRMWGGLAALETAPQPTADDWRVCSDAVNLMETLVFMGEVQDPDGLINDCAQALAEAGQRHRSQGTALRLTGPGLQSLRGVLEDYATALAQLPARVMVRCHRLTEKRIAAIVRGQKKAHDLVVVAL
jgi:hypothetical protein